MIPLAGNKMFLVRFRYRHCYVSVAALGLLYKSSFGPCRQLNSRRLLHTHRRHRTGWVILIWSIQIHQTSGGDRSSVQTTALHVVVCVQNNKRLLFRPRPSSNIAHQDLQWSRPIPVQHIRNRNRWFGCGSCFCHCLVCCSCVVTQLLRGS